jgi:hypothetical protein
MGGGVSGLLAESLSLKHKTPAQTLTASGCCDPTVLASLVFLLPRPAQRALLLL